jgi:aspartyl-tRNA(Asn)/glutamyl-tRNA(Gln) amidotransferase subunit C|tara:strand:- start:1202 stop:1486 length:285 start_codon:yes stop_codon:yes gene_type:complete
MKKDIDIKSVAKLAAINLSEHEEKKLEKDLNIILEHVEALSKMDIDDEEISIHPLGEILNLREDISSEFLTHDEAMSNSPETEDGHFVVPPSLD